MQYYNLQNNSHRGFTLLYASLVASLLTALGLIMFSIAQKEIVLSSSGRESQFAFYAADTGLECALYWEFQHDAFNPEASPTTDATCGNDALVDLPNDDGGGDSEGIYDGINGLGGGATTRFYFEPEGRCVYVTVKKSDTAPYTTIESFGYNTACDKRTNPRRLERAVRATF